jgi:hypothetical protein
MIRKLHNKEKDPSKSITGFIKIIRNNFPPIKDRSKR